MAHELTFEEIQECKRIFEEFKITIENVEDSKMRIADLENALNMLDFKISTSELNEICVSMNLDSEIDFMTFLRVAAVKFKQKEFMIYMHDSFKAFDKNNKNYLDFDELKSILTKHGPKLTDDGAQDFLTELGISENSNFFYDDFINENI